MNGSKMEHARAAIRELVGRLGPEDRFSLVSYADRAAIEIALAPARVNGLLGTALSRDEIEAYLARVGVEPASESESGGGGCGDGDEPGRYAIPSHRNDLRIAEDLIEEVARIHGLDRIPATVQRGPLQTSPASLSSMFVVDSDARDY